MVVKKETDRVIIYSARSAVMRAPLTCHLMAMCARQPAGIRIAGPQWNVADIVVNGEPMRW